FVQAAGTGDRDFLFSASAKVFSADIEDTVRVDVECDFNLRHAARSRWNSIEMENAQLFVIARQRSLALEDFDFHTRLIVAVSRKDLRLASRNCGIPRNHRRRTSGGGFVRTRHRRHAPQENGY